MQGLTGRGGDGSAATFAYAASKHGVVGLMRSAANAYAQHNIRVNSVHPTGVATPMIFNEHMAAVFAENPDSSAMTGNLLPVPFVEPSMSPMPSSGSSATRPATSPGSRCRWMLGSR
jgi:NAD(P)-dependent dehydrogenase (short-subunit alcohol dehydrogenase family)